MLSWLREQQEREENFIENLPDDLLAGLGAKVLGQKDQMNFKNISFWFRRWGTKTEPQAVNESLRIF